MPTNNRRKWGKKEKEKINIRENAFVSPALEGRRKAWSRDNSLTS